MKIMLRQNPNTDKQDIIVQLECDPDAPLIEHEQMHRQLVEKLIGKGMKPEDVGELIIARESS